MNINKLSRLLADRHTRNAILGGFVVSLGLSMELQDESSISNASRAARRYMSNIQTTSMETARASITSNHKNKSTRPVEKHKKIKEYDFIVLGHGNAGRSAVQTLCDTCPSARIALIDPIRSPPDINKVDHLAFTATGFHPSTRTVQLSNSDVELRYRHSILVATGSRGAPPPMALFDPQILNRVLELRPTEMAGSPNRPVLPPETTRALALMAAAQGAAVGVLGSGWEAIELAAAASERGKTAPSITFGSAGPLSHILPRYLSLAVNKRLKQVGIQVQERSLVRYVAEYNHRQGSTARLEVHSVKAYDVLDTTRTQVDVLVIAPFVAGHRGTAVLPTLNVPGYLAEESRGRSWFQSWSQLTSAPSEPSAIVCYGDDGRISVNAELNAASKVYAAGSVAKYPNSVTGHAHIAGEGQADGALAGRMAALHMARDYHERNRFSLTAPSIEAAPFAMESFPVFRSDVVPYMTADGRNESALASVGIEALCVGQCDSERMSTHGFWFTNAASKRRNSASRTKERRKKRKRAENLPVYGSGVVFYLDRAGKIRGAMVWGLPFANKKSKDLNRELVDRIKQIILSNGDITKAQTDNDPLLRSTHLEEEAKRLAKLAVSSQSGSKKPKVSVPEMPKPLHRFTPARPPSITSVGMLRRKDQSDSDGLLGENLYIKDEDACGQIDSTRPPTLLYVYPMHSPHYSADDDNWNDPYQLSREERNERVWKDNDLRSRPPKEEPLWFRRGDAQRGVAAHEVMAEQFMFNIRKGRFSDGSEALHQAPRPKAVHEAKSRIQEWMRPSSEDELDSNGDDNDNGDGGKEEKQAKM